MYLDYAQQYSPPNVSFASPILSPSTSLQRIKSLHSSPGTPSTLFHIYSHRESSPRSLSHSLSRGSTPASSEKVRTIKQMPSTIYTPEPRNTIVPYFSAVHNKDVLKLFMSSITEL